MKRDSLAPPEPDSPALERFLEHFGLDRGAERDAILCGAAAAFSRIPYENLTKIVKRDREGAAGRARREPLEVISDHAASGSGGTCFSLTAALLHVVRALGFEAEPVLADRRYGQNTHCALLVWIGGAPHLVDPGYLIVRPVPLPREAPARFTTPFNDVVLTPREGGSKVDLHTLQGGSRAYRLTIKSSPADASEFLAAWDASFDWDMMRYPLLTRVRGGEQLYLQGRRLQVRSSAGVRRTEVDPLELPDVIAREFGVDPSIASKAIEILGRKGERLDAAPAR